MLIFLDTEFTDFIDPQLISLGMYSERGEAFYVEVPYSNEACSAFVCEAVIPLLGRYPDAPCLLDDLSLRIIKWLESVRSSEEDVAICFDFQTDWDLFIDALDYRAPPWCRGRHVGRNINKLLRYEFHKRFQVPGHHALYDAMANDFAFRERPSATTWKYLS